MEHAVEGDRVGAADDRDFECGDAASVQRVVDHLEQHLAGQHAGLELQRVELAGGAIVDGAHQVLAVTPTEQDGVVAQATIDGVVSSPTHKPITAVPTGQQVGTGVPNEGVIAGATSALPTAGAGDQNLRRGGSRVAGTRQNTLRHQASKN